jgi:hypothetical protein
MLAHYLVVFWQVHDALIGQYKIRIGEETLHCGEGAFAYLHRASRTHSSTRPTTRAKSSWSTPPAAVTSSTKNWGPLTRNGTPDRVAVAAVFEKYDMTLLGPPITDD